MGEIHNMESLGATLASSVDHNQPIIIDWMASWCRKCIYLKPKLEKIAGEFLGVRFYFVDVNKVPQAVVKRGNISLILNLSLLPSVSLHLPSENAYYSGYDLLRSVKVRICMPDGSAETVISEQTPLAV
ncbi:hypothetical protein ZWY2020_049401 [Hordeum vulgare]|nr:hypothetical protein ZWY2020_049401 [Hordeum vulgare]